MGWRIFMALSGWTILIATEAHAAGATADIVQLGASKARDCLKIAATGPYKADRMHKFAECLKEVATPIEYSSTKEKDFDAGVFIAGRYILAREFGQIDQYTYGRLGRLQFDELEADYRWAVDYLKDQGLTKSAVCAAIEWVDCKILP
jgi:hypothetical protein